MYKIVGCLFLWLIFTLWDTAVKRNKNMVYLLPFLYLIIRGFGEFGGIIGNSSSNLDFLFDIYMNILTKCMIMCYTKSSVAKRLI